ncbi:MAG: ferredoxin [Candidatus Aenigmarchaeota archaeon]|nr:ferredoxin [Candidatus Aenigmarchaeota archaeon]
MKIVFDRNKCTGAYSCVQEEPEKWKPASDGKVDLDGSVQKKPGIFECAITQEELEKARIAAAVCPASAIKVVEE